MCVCEDYENRFYLHFLFFLLFYVFLSSFCLYCARQMDSSIAAAKRLLCVAEKSAIGLLRRKTRLKENLVSREKKRERRVTYEASFSSGVISDDKSRKREKIVKKILSYFFG